MWRGIAWHGLAWHVVLFGQKQWYNWTHTQHLRFKRKTLLIARSVCITIGDVACVRCLWLLSFSGFFFIARPPIDSTHTNKTKVHKKTCLCFTLIITKTIFVTELRVEYFDVDLVRLTWLKWNQHTHIYNKTDFALCKSKCGHNVVIAFAVLYNGTMVYCILIKSIDRKSRDRRAVCVFDIYILGILIEWVSEWVSEWAIFSVGIQKYAQKQFTIYKWNGDKCLWIEIDCHLYIRYTVYERINIYLFLSIVKYFVAHNYLAMFKSLPNDCIAFQLSILFTGDS